MPGEAPNSRFILESDTRVNTLGVQLGGLAVFGNTDFLYDSFREPDCDQVGPEAVRVESVKDVVQLIVEAQVLDETS
ncbi:MAG TPA: hypothetical protein PKB09_00825 [Candidatus Saccharibacteria bacterium]|nr:hypothetical protein [Candidatus Saccharibacteria bacterium]